jgi:5-methylcytosine-specific restriction enzyme A
MNRPCLVGGPGCSDNGLAVPGSSRCRAHGGRAWRVDPSRQSTYRGNWPQQRVRALERDGYVCQLRYRGCLGRASEVDHIVQPEAGGDNSLSNLRAVCRRCHATRTGRQGALAKQRASKSVHPQKDHNEP